MSDSNSPLEWGDEDALTARFARVTHVLDDASLSCPGAGCPDAGSAGSDAGGADAGVVADGGPARLDAAPSSPADATGAADGEANRPVADAEPATDTRRPQRVHGDFGPPLESGSDSLCRQAIGRGGHPVAALFLIIGLALLGRRRRSRELLAGFVRAPLARRPPVD